MSEERKTGNLVQLGALWKQEGKNGKDPYLSGSFGSAQVFVFKNGFKKEGSNEPDYRIMVGAKARKPKDEDRAEEPKSEEVPF